METFAQLFGSLLALVALGPLHGYGISQRIRQISKDALQVQQGSLYPALH
ncbi:MAG TPA: helix-turn-helix transcriptional regulator, partial [Terriglobales bacterium]